MISIAIDGPSGAGKSTIARQAAQQLKYLYLDTGALYRTIGLFAHENGVPDDNEEALAPRLSEIDIQLCYQEGEQRVLLCGRDVSEEIRRPEMGMAASHVSALPAVRDFLLELQRSIARSNNVIMDGRDIGTVVLPRADVKLYLTASPEARARRRLADFAAKGENISLEQVLEDINQRDYNDTHRKIAPLRQAEDAILLDTSEIGLEESIALVLRTVAECLSKKQGGGAS